MIINPDGSVQFEGDVQKLLSGRGAGAASGSTLAEQNEAYRLGKYGAEELAKRKAAGAKFGGARAAASPHVGPAARPGPISTPTEVNPAPVATSEAANALSFGQRAMRYLRFGGNALTAAGIGYAGAKTANTVANKTTEDYEKELAGLGVSQNPKYDSNALKFVRDLGVRGLGALVDLGRTVNPFSGGGARAAAIPTGTVAAAPSGPQGDIFPKGVNTAHGVRADAASLLLDSSDTLAPGLGIFRNERTGAVTTLNTGEPAAQATAPAGPAPAPEIAAPTLGTNGGIFSNLVNFANETSAAKLATARNARDYRRSVTAAGLALKGEDAASRRISAAGALLRGQGAAAAAANAGTKVVQDAAGNPVVVNIPQNRATVLTPNKPITEGDVQATMKANKMTRAQVIERLRAEGRLGNGGIAN